MRQAEVQVGGRYMIRVSGGPLTVVKITGHRDGSAGRPARYTGVNEATGRQLSWFTAARLRGPAKTKTTAAAPPADDRLVCGRCGDVISRAEYTGASNPPECDPCRKGQKGL